MLTTLDFWKSQGIGGDVFYIETISRHCDRQQSTKIGVEGKVFILVHNFLAGQYLQPLFCVVY